MTYMAIRLTLVLACCRPGLEVSQLLQLGQCMIDAVHPAEVIVVFDQVQFLQVFFHLLPEAQQLLRLLPRAVEPPAGDLGSVAAAFLGSASSEKHPGEDGGCSGLGWCRHRMPFGNIKYLLHGGRRQVDERTAVDVWQDVAVVMEGPELSLNK